jgi:hypothetical protein
MPLHPQNGSAVREHMVVDAGTQTAGIEQPENPAMHSNPDGHVPMPVHVMAPVSPGPVSPITSAGLASVVSSAASPAAESAFVGPPQAVANEARSATPIDRRKRCMPRS